MARSHLRNPSFTWNFRITRPRKHNFTRRESISRSSSSVRRASLAVIKVTLFHYFLFLFFFQNIASITAKLIHIWVGEPTPLQLTGAVFQRCSVEAVFLKDSPN